VIAVWTYVMIRDRTADRQDRAPLLYSNVVGPYWPPERRITEERYQTIEFPSEFNAPDFRDRAAPDARRRRRVRAHLVGERASIKRHDGIRWRSLVNGSDRSGAIRDITLARWPVAMRVGRIE